MKPVERCTRFLESLVFGQRWLTLGLIVAALVLAGRQAWPLTLEDVASKQLPRDHPWVQADARLRAATAADGRFVVELAARRGDIFQPALFDALRRVADALPLLPGVDRDAVRSLFSADARFFEIVEDGFTGGPIVPARFRATPDDIARVRQNLLDSPEVGRLVARDFKSCLVEGRLLHPGVDAAARIDAIARQLAALPPLSPDASAEVGLTVHREPEPGRLTGFASALGRLARGAAVAAILLTLVARFLLRSFRLAFLPLLAAALAVVGELGLAQFLGYGLGPLSLLAPFLVAAVALAHGFRCARLFREQVIAGESSAAAARAVFRQRWWNGWAAYAGTAGVLCGLGRIRIGIIEELVVQLLLGLSVTAVVELLALPVIISWIRVPPRLRPKVAVRRVRIEWAWRAAGGFIRPGPAAVLTLLTLAGGCYLWWQGPRVLIDDPDPGAKPAPAVWRYDPSPRLAPLLYPGVARLTLTAESAPNGCIDFAVMSRLDDLEWTLRNVSGVAATTSLAATARRANALWNEGSLKWQVLPSVSASLARATQPGPGNEGLINADGSTLPVPLLLARPDLAEGERILGAAEAAAKRFSSDRVHFQIGGGSLALRAATNAVVSEARRPLLFWLLGAVAGAAVLRFLSLRALLCLTLPLGAIALLPDGMLQAYNRTLTPATLPLATLGVAFGVSLSLRVLARLRWFLRQAQTFDEAVAHCFRETAVEIVFSGMALCAAAGIWWASPIAYQSEIGLQLAGLFATAAFVSLFVVPAFARWLHRARPAAAAQQLTFEKNLA